MSANAYEAHHTLALKHALQSDVSVLLAVVRAASRVGMLSPAGLRFHSFVTMELFRVFGAPTIGEARRRIYRVQGAVEAIHEPWGELEPTFVEPTLLLSEAVLDYAEWLLTKSHANVRHGFRFRSAWVKHDLYVHTVGVIQRDLQAPKAPPAVEPRFIGEPDPPDPRRGSRAK